MKSLIASLAAPRLNPDIIMWAGGFALAGCLWYLLLHEHMNLLFAIFFAGSLLLICMHDKMTGVIWTFGYLLVMGDLRRIFSVSFGQPKLDLLLLVAPLVAFVLAAPIFLRIRLKDTLSKGMLALLVVMILQIFNPQQGGVTVGVTGALFYIVPVLWFWVGRQIGSPTVISRLLYKCVFPLALCAAVMGVCQTFIGFLPYQQAWIDVAKKTYVSLSVGTTTRAFGFSVSAAEYAALLMLGATGAAAAYFSSRRIWTLALPFLIATLVLASSRGNVVKLIFSFAIVYTLRAGTKLNTRAMLRLGVFTVVGLVGVSVLASRFAGSSDASPHYQKGAAAQNAIEHQASGLAHPLDARSSTVGVHSQVLADGFLEGFKTPLGHGLGATTLAARRLGGDTSTGSSEFDFTDMFISLGLIGGLIYLFVVYQSIQSTLRYVQVVPKEIGLPVLGILAATVTSWLIGGQYSTSSILFFLIGGLAYAEDRANVDLLPSLR